MFLLQIFLRQKLLGQNFLRQKTHILRQKLIFLRHNTYFFTPGNSFFTPKTPKTFLRRKIDK